MNKKVIILLGVFAALFSSCKKEHSDLKDGLYAEIKTNKGAIILQLEYEKAPITVANFITLSEGKNTFVSEKFKDKPFYNGLTFHRVEPGFVIQGGDPLGNGNGDAGYSFKNEITTLSHDKAGTLAMANSGPDTNGCQFYITHVPTQRLDGGYSIFGYVVGKGMETVNKIAIGDKIEKISILRIGKKAESFDAVKVFSDYFSAEAENKKKNDAQFKAVADEKIASFAAQKAKAITLPSGLSYFISSKGSGVKPKDGTPIKINYSGFFENGLLFDSSDEAVSKAYGKYDSARAQQGGYSPIPTTAGAKTGMIPGFLEGISQLSYGDKATVFIPSKLGYGEVGAGGGIIPPNANLIFEIELIK